MALLSRLLGHASDLTPEQTREELDGILLPEEPVEVAFKVIRDLFVFTDRRLILVDKQGVTSRKIDYLVVPYRAITSYSIETAGTLDMDSESQDLDLRPDGSDPESAQARRQYPGHPSGDRCGSLSITCPLTWCGAGLMPRSVPPRGDRHACQSSRRERLRAAQL
jgi:hypothetical protein